jgi:Flp pilus assembly protein TadG
VSPSATDRRALLSDRRGATAVEFGLIGIIFLTLLLGVVELGRYYYTVQSVRALAADAARWSMIQSNLSLNSGSPCTTTAPTIDSTVKTTLTARYPLIRTAQPPLEIRSLRRCYVPPVIDSATGNITSPAVNAYVQVRVLYTFAFLVPFLPGTVPRIDETAILEFQ